MNLSYFISKRIAASGKDSFSSTIHKIAVGSIGVGLAVMIISFLILKGFQDTVTDKIYSFSSHLLITKYTLGNSYEEAPISINNELYNNYKKYDFIDHVQEYSHKAGLIKTNDEVLGIIFKGVGTSFDQQRFKPNLVEGRFVKFDSSGYSKEVLISRIISNKLKLNVGDDVVIHFFQNPPRVRKLKIVGIYETNLSEYFDDKFVIGDIGLIQKLNNWADSVAGGMEVFVKNESKIDEGESKLEDIVDYDLFVEKVSDKYLQVFDWLHLISRQVNIFLAIILFVVCVNMISIILILIMERTQMIGLLKAFGANNGLIRKIFSFNGMQLIAKGLLLGNLLGVGLGAVQYYFQLIPLNPHDYYMSYVPIGWSWEIIVGLNLLTFVVVSLIIIVPTTVIARINPIKSIKYD
ncbi:ABC transporter permease [Fulvivirga sediminis]|uniref:ABC transporter permease n=1 Tax=Fulvivirga sediminis TaxID=2803949 RepID=A0A937FA38_9BACT|nr:FtsX-like permease family protein [Fulvivirga sediminis]MBL3658051.1 ABC transporter permease [Fulvivirga sediminis]